MKLTYRRRTVAEVLDCSEGQVLKFERAGLLHARRPAGLRCVFYDPTEVAALAQRLLGTDATTQQDALHA